MSDVFFTTNPAEFTKLEGLYVSERNPPGFIRGRDLSTVGFAGRCVRGPTAPQTITSTGRFLEIYGGRDQGSGGSIVGEVWAALLNKRFGTVVVRRVVASDAVAATVTMDDTAGAGGTNVLTLTATSVGAWGNNVTASVEAATDADANHFNLRVVYLGREVLYQNLDISGSNDNLAATIGTDEANLIVATKLASGRPHNQSSTALATGAEGTLAAADYASGITDIAQFPGVSICLVPEAVPTHSTFQATLVTLAASVSDRIFLTWSGVHGQSSSTEITNVGAQITTRSDRIWWCYNSPYTIDPETGAEQVTAPHVWMASILSQIDVDVHPGAFETLPLLAGIKRLSNVALTRSDLINLRNAGISTIERLVEGFLFRSVVTTNLNPGLTEGTRRRMVDFLQLSASDRLRTYVKKKNTATVRALMAAELTAFSRSLQDDERIISEDDSSGRGFIIESESVNTPQGRAQGLEKLLWRVRLIGHILYLVLETEIGTGVVIEAAA